MSAVCPVCERQQDAGLLCSACCDVLERELGDVAAIVGELDVSLSKQARIGTPGKSGLARERIPINVGAMQAADNLGNVLTTWARDVSPTPHDVHVDLRKGRADCSCGNWWTTTGAEMALLTQLAWAHVKTAQAEQAREPAKAAAAILLTEIPAIRRHPAVDELVDEITDAVHQARRAVDRPADKVYLSQCLMENPDEEGRQVTCLAELYARPEASEVRCSVCGAEHPVAERRRWLLERAADMLFTAKEAAMLIGEVGGIKVTEASIRGYLHRGARLQYRAPVEAKRFRLGDLLAVVLDESERKSA